MPQAPPSQGRPDDYLGQDPGSRNLSGLRKLLGGIGLIAGIGIYALTMMHIGADIIPTHWLIQLIFYAAAGIAWIWPAKHVMRWAQR